MRFINQIILEFCSSLLIEVLIVFYLMLGFDLGFVLILMRAL